MFNVLKLVHRLPNVDLDDLCRRMLGDTKAKGLNPHLMHRKRGAAAKLAAEPAAGPEYGPRLAAVLIPKPKPVPKPSPAPVDPDDAPLAALGAASVPSPGAAGVAPCAAVAAPSGRMSAKEYMAYINAATPLPPKRKFKMSARVVAAFQKKQKKSDDT